VGSNPSPALKNISSEHHVFFRIYDERKKEERSYNKD